MTWSPPPTPGPRTRAPDGQELPSGRAMQRMEDCVGDESCLDPGLDRERTHLPAHGSHTGCLHCIECCAWSLEKAGGGINEDRGQAQAFVRMKWPGGYLSPVQYFAARRRQLQMLNRLPKQAVSELERRWAKPEKPIDAVCPLRHRRRRSPLLILIPHTRTNVKEEDSVVFAVGKNGEQVVIQDGAINFSSERGFAGQCLSEMENVTSSPASPFPFATMLRSFFHSEIVDRWFKAGRHGKKRRTEASATETCSECGSKGDSLPAAAVNLGGKLCGETEESVDLAPTSDFFMGEVDAEREHVVAIPEETQEKNRTWAVSAATSMLAAAFLGFTMIARG